MPVWFTIKAQPTVQFGARHLFKMIRLSRYLDPNLRNVVDTVIQKNGFYAHPESVLLSMATDRRPEVRKRAASSIIEARQRQESETDCPVRHFRVPQINFTADDYTKIIDFKEMVVSAPPILREIPTD